MNRLEAKWVNILESLKERYPNLADHIVEWYPSGQMEIIVRLDDNVKYTYDLISGIARPIRTDNSCGTEEEWRLIFATNLKNKLYHLGMSQEMLCERAGVSRITISKYINGKATPSSYTLRKISKVLNCSIYELIE